MAGSWRLRAQLLCVLILTFCAPVRSNAKIKKSAINMMREARVAMSSSEVVTTQKEFRCPTENGDFAAGKSSRRFYRCRGGVARIKDCSPQTVFDPERGYCKPGNATPSASPSNDSWDIQTPTDNWDLYTSYRNWDRQASHSDEEQSNKSGVSSQEKKNKNTTSKCQNGDVNDNGDCYYDNDADYYDYDNKADKKRRNGRKKGRKENKKSKKKRKKKKKRKGRRRKKKNKKKKKKEKKRDKWEESVEYDLDPGEHFTWFCTDGEAGLSPLVRQHDTVERCWAEALRRRAHYLAVGPTGCRVGKRVDRLRAVPCSNTSRHVINVQFFQRDLIRLNPDYRYWISGKPASGVVWDTVSGARNVSSALAACSSLCSAYGQDFARVDHLGCRCGRAAGSKVQIRHEELRWTAGRPAAVQPGFTVKLRAGNVTGWMCTAAPSDFVAFTGAQTMQEALEACQRRRFQFLAAGEDGFFCGNNTANLERFSISQCEMRLSKRRSYSVISINEIERQITHVEESVREYIFWWVSEKPSAVFWTTLADVSSLEQCVLQCERRFICIGADGCSCGSLGKHSTELQVQEWVKTQPRKEIGSTQGFLMLDKKGNANVPEGWTCTTEPTQWRKTGDQLFQRCLASCSAAKSKFVAFGKGGCRCGDSGAGFRHLALPHCQNPQAAPVQPYSVLFVDVWTNNYHNYTTKAGSRAFWVAQKPAGVRWRAAPGRTVLDDCVSACRDRAGVKLVLVGVDGCECGFTTRGGFTSELAWSVRSKDGPARGFLLVQMDTVSKGYKAPVFSWVTKRNNTHRKENKVKAVPTWIRVNIAEARRRQLRRSSRLSRVETESESVHRTSGGNQRGLVQQRRRAVTETRANATQAGRALARNATGATGEKEEAKVSRTTEKVGRTNRQRNTLRESEKNYVSAGKNEITVGSNKRRLVNIETENAARKAAEAYKKHTITGEQTAGTIEQFISGEKAQLVRVNNTRTRLLEKSVAANQTHLATEATAHNIRRLNLRQSRVTERKRGKTLSLQVHIGGRCYVGSANRSEWKGPLPGKHTPFKCLCACVRDNGLFYAIYETNLCFCAKDAGNFGNNTGSITTTDKCPQAGARIVYNGVKNTRRMAQFCKRSGAAASTVLHLGKTTLNAGERLIEFNNTENLRALKKSSSLRATHHRRTEEDVKTDLLREHRKRGTIKETWRSKLSKGVFQRLFRLRLHVRREHNVTENVNLITKKEVRSQMHERARVFLPTSAPKKIKTKKY